MTKTLELLNLELLQQSIEGESEEVVTENEENAAIGSDATDEEETQAESFAPTALDEDEENKDEETEDEDEGEEDDNF